MLTRQVLEAGSIAAAALTPLLLGPAVLIAGTRGDGAPRPAEITPTTATVIEAPLLRPEQPLWAEARAYVEVREGQCLPVVALRVTGLEAGQRVLIGWGPPDSEYELFHATRADWQGRISIALPVDVVDVCEGVLVVVSARTEQVLAVSAPFVLPFSGDERIDTERQVRS